MTSPVRTRDRRTAEASESAALTVAMAAVIGAHGLAGEVKLKVFADDLTPYRSFNGGALTLRSLREGGIARFVEVADRTAAEALRGTLLTIPREALPPLPDGEYYHVDLMGLAVDTDAGAPVGRVAAVDNFGAGDILDIEKPDGKRFMVPVAVATIGERIVIPAAFAD